MLIDIFSFFFLKQDSTFDIWQHIVIFQPKATCHLSQLCHLSRFFVLFCLLFSLELVEMKIPTVKQLCAKHTLQQIVSLESCEAENAFPCPQNTRVEIKTREDWDWK